MMLALHPRDIALSLAVVAVGWPVMNLIDRIAFGIQCAKAACQ